MDNNYLSTISSKGQITIPKDLRESLGLDTGQLVGMKAMDGKLTLFKASLNTDDFSGEEWEKLRELASSKGRTHSSGKKFIRSLK